MSLLTAVHQIILHSFPESHPPVASTLQLYLYSLPNSPRRDLQHVSRHVRRPGKLALYQSCPVVQSNQRAFVQVANELKKMTAFIRQEALEKAREIQIKADEEFAIEKSKIVRQETSAIDSTYAKKHKQASMSQQITRSTLANKTRLRVLGRRQELLNVLFEKAGDQLSGYSKEGSKYDEMCKGLILEGLYALNESKVAVRARKQDYDTVKKSMKAAEKEYKEKLGKDVEVGLDEKNPLSEGS